MKTRTLSILTAAAMLLTLLPTAALAEELPQEQCACVSLCTEGEINPDCPVCGVEGVELSTVCKPVQPDPESDPDPDPTPGPTVQTVTGWSWVDEDDVLSGNTLTVPNQGGDAPAWEQVVSWLPTQITATVAEVSDPVTLALGEWSCPDYDPAAPGSYPAVTALAGDTYMLCADVAPLSLAVELSALDSGANLLADDFTVGAFRLTSDSDLISGTDYSDANNTLPIKSGTAVTISTSSPTTSDHIVVEDGTTANITLSGVDIQFSDGNWSTPGTCAFEIVGDATCNLTLATGSTNTLKSGTNKAGLQVQETAKLTITEGSLGTLTASGGMRGAGIGSGYQSTGGIIAIAGGTVTATGGGESAGVGGGGGSPGGSITIEGGTVTANGNSGAGIGGGVSSMGGNITIKDGTVTATGGNSSAGIGGGGMNGAGGTITISGGTVTATGGQHSAGIGGGWGGTGGEINIRGGNVTATGGYVGDGVGGYGGSITITGGKVSATSGTGGDGVSGDSLMMDGPCFLSANTKDVATTRVTQGFLLVDGSATVAGEVTLPDEPAVTIGGGKALTVRSGAVLTIPDGVTLTVDGLLQNSGTVTNLGTIKGSGNWTGNEVSGASMQMPDKGEGTVDIAEGDVILYETAYSVGGALYAYDVKNSGVILYGESNQYTVTVGEQQTIFATLDRLSIHVSGNEQCAFDCTDGKATLTLVGENYLGSGLRKAGLQAGVGATLSIRGDGSLEAAGGDGAAGIGGGYDGSGGNITIAGGAVTAMGSANMGIGGSAGIGGGYGGSGGVITITGGIVTATGGMTEPSKGNESGAGIGGGGMNGAGGTITISGGTVTATGGNSAAGIGGGCPGDGGKITITGGHVTAYGDSQGAAGIGGGYGYGGSGGEITISGGTVAATGGGDGAGIGGGFSGSGGVITINGGTVTAASENDGAGIGGGFSGHAALSPSMVAR